MLDRNNDKELALTSSRTLLQREPREASRHVPLPEALAQDRGRHVVASSMRPVASMASRRPSRVATPSRERPSGVENTLGPDPSESRHAGTSSACLRRHRQGLQRSRRGRGDGRLAREGPRCCRASTTEKLLRSQEDRNIGEITLPPHLREVKDRIADEVYKRTRANGRRGGGNRRQPAAGRILD